MSGRRIVALWLLFAAVACVDALLVRGIRAGKVPSWVYWADASLPCDLDGDGTDELVTVAGKTLSVMAGGETLYQSPKEWQVMTALVGDVDHDGVDNLLVLFWRRGSYGTSRPFWVEADHGLGQHISLLGWKRGTLVQRWTSSALHEEVASAHLDGDQRLVLIARDGGMTCWEWQEWGFVLVGKAIGGDAEAA